MVINTDVTFELSARWGDSGSDPLADLQRFRETFARIPTMRPNTMILPLGRWRKIQRIAFMQTHGKRAWRRRRGKLKGAGQW